jgi:hypothetical protein
MHADDSDSYDLRDGSIDGSVPSTMQSEHYSMEDVSGTWRATDSESESFETAAPGSTDETPTDTDDGDNGESTPGGSTSDGGETTTGGGGRGHGESTNGGTNESPENEPGTGGESSSLHFNPGGVIPTFPGFPYRSSKPATRPSLPGSVIVPHDEGGEHAAAGSSSSFASHAASSASSFGRADSIVVPDVFESFGRIIDRSLHPFLWTAPTAESPVDTRTSSLAVIVAILGAALMEYRIFVRGKRPTKKTKTKRAKRS